MVLLSGRAGGAAELRVDVGENNNCHLPYWAGPSQATACARRMCKFTRTALPWLAEEHRELGPRGNRKSKGSFRDIFCCNSARAHIDWSAPLMFEGYPRCSKSIGEPPPRHPEAKRTKTLRGNAASTIPGQPERVQREITPPAVAPSGWRKPHPPTAGANSQFLPWRISHRPAQRTHGPIAPEAVCPSYDVPGGVPTLTYPKTPRAKVDGGPVPAGRSYVALSLVRRATSRKATRRKCPPGRPIAYPKIPDTDPGGPGGTAFEDDGNPNSRNRTGE